MINNTCGNCKFYIDVTGICTKSSISIDVSGDDMACSRWQPIEIWCDLITVERAKAEYRKLWLQTERLFPSMTEDDRARVISLVVGTCPGCYEEGGNTCGSFWDR